MAKNRHNPRLARARTRQLDDTLRAINVPSRPNTGWIRTIRTALGLSQQQLASRLEMTRQNIGSLERQEVARRITLETLGRVAAALDCDVQYALVPRTSLDETIERQALYRARRQLERVNASQSLEASELPSDSLDRAIRDLADEMKTARPKDLWDTYD